MDLGLEHRVALVTGASVGMGRASALALADEGARVALVSLTPERLEKTEAEVAERGVEVASWPADLSQPGEGERVVAAAHEHFGTLDLLVNTVGPTTRSQGFLDQDDELWRAAFEALLMSAVRTCRAAIPIMRAQGRGAIVNISAMSIRHWIPQLAHYSAAKAAVAHLTKNLAKEFVRDGIRTNAVMPGMIASEPVRERITEAAREKGMTDQEYFEDANRRHGGATWADRLGTPEEIANVVTFLASDRASYVNGAFVNVDGGSSF